MNDANNAGTLAPCKFCGTYPNPNDPSCATLEQAYARTEVRPFGCPYFTDSGRKMYPLSTPNAPVELAGLLLRLRSRTNDAPMDHEHMMDEAIEALESQAKALSEAEARADTWPQWAESIWAKLQEYGYQADDDYTVDLAEVFDEWADGFDAACTARALAAEARLAEAMKVIERDMEALTEADTQIEYLHDKFKPTGSGANAIARIDIALTAARAFTNAAKEKTDAMG